MMFDFGIESATRFEQIAYYGHLWLVEFRDWATCIVIEDDPLIPRQERSHNFIIEQAGSAHDHHQR